ncbi:MAG: hypothetical protein HC895_03720 [Leptolyngbyaceae cyanobacterium SM1_3_5]|nr:hypothetical protein [Leptolyngbyaceae cyanobacterium SM1_3_5]
MRLDTDIEPILSKAKRRDGDRLSLMPMPKRCGRATVQANGDAQSPGSKAKQKSRVATGWDRAHLNPVRPTTRLQERCAIITDRSCWDGVRR